MKIAVSAQGETLESATSPVFGRCPDFVFVDSETMRCEAVSNPGIDETGGAGVQAAQLVVRQGAQAVLTGRLGPNATAVLEAAGVPGYAVPEGTVADAVRAFLAGSLPTLGGASGPTAAVGGGGVGPGWGRGRGAGGRGMGWRRGRWGRGPRSAP